MRDVFYKILLILFVGILCTNTTSFGSETPKDVEVLKTYKDKHGNTVRKIRYKKGNSIVTETTITPPFPSLKDRTPINVDTLNPDSLMILVEKSKYLVAVIYKRQRIRQYKAVFGPERLEDKKMEGDRMTPEGWFKVVSKRNHANWQKFILLDYPNENSYKNFRENKAKGIIPPNARIGGSIGFHGTLKGAQDMVDYGIGWTDGCIALKPEDIEDLYLFLQAGTRVYVRR
ncbi:MAG TPA: L,D-transpeptidase [Chitinophagaceae bacterium]|nr:L,D-transpeptidase [Chitinophagaceae bacterium]